MINKKVQATIAGESIQLWFNKYGLLELGGYYGVTEQEVVAKIKEKTNNNLMALMADIVYMGRAGYCLANAKDIDMTLPDARLKAIETEDSEMLKVWRAFLDAFGFNQPEEKYKKKAMKKPLPTKKS